MKKKINKNFNKAEEEYRKYWFKNLWPETAEEKKEKIENKSKKYNRPDYRHSKGWNKKDRKYLINVSDAAKFLGRSPEQMKDMILGVKGYRKLDYIYEKENHSIKFDLKTLQDYRRWLDEER